MRTPAQLSANIPLQWLVGSGSMQGWAGSQLKANSPALLHPEIRSFVQLVNAHARKEYISGPLIHRVDRQPDGWRPLGKDDGWTAVWGRLTDTTLSIWDTKEAWETATQEKDMQSSYILNVADAVRSAKAFFT